MSASLVQYIVVRGDLLTALKWPTGAVIAQACHACTAVMHLFRDDDNVLKYTADLDNMHKVILEAKSEEDVKNLSEKLTEHSVDHKLWIEQPENFATCLAVKPYPKEEVQKYFKKFKLYK
ncbi:putative peptidyl-tRNA hydrolase PTRHD1 [Diadema antillarum]|uniref:putative peptidyl-tRNA hydrolase PTRHD1 n=1 Tax=Diadema antillarum TaxID=105358 RepID=UPI003A84F1DD